MLLIVLGLVVFEVVMSIDNAVINADVISTMKSERARRFFLTWGIFFAVFVVRGVLPAFIVFFANPSVGIFGAFSSTWSNDPSVLHAIEAATPVIMMAGGVFLLLLWLHWLFIENRKFGFAFEEPVKKYGGVWFYALAALLLVGTLIAINETVIIAPMHLALASAVGFSAFFITQGFKENAEEVEKRLISSGEKSAMSDWAKVAFLEVIDLTFSIDGVIGAFAFTTVVPLILLGNGIGAIIIRQLTMHGVQRIRSYSYLKNGAMYSIGFLGVVMMLHAFHVDVPVWVSPMVTFSAVGYFFWRSVDENKKTAILNNNKQSIAR